MPVKDEWIVVRVLKPNEQLAPGMHVCTFVFGGMNPPVHYLIEKIGAK